MGHYPIRKEIEIRLQPITLGRGTDYTGQPVMAAEAWQFGVHKPRNEKRKEEIPPADVSLENLPNLFNWVKVKETAVIRDIADARSFVDSDGDSDAYVVSSSSTAESGALYAVLAQKGIPILPAWDNWGFSWRARYTKCWADEIGFKTYSPGNARDVETLLKALRACNKLRRTKILYIGGIPSHSVTTVTRPIEIYQKFKADFHRIDFTEYVQAVERQAKTPEAAEMAEAWKKQFDAMDGRGPAMHRYTAIYLALRELLAKYDANALTVDCAFLPDIDYVACVAASFLIDEGVAFGCEGDISQVVSLALLMGVSGKPGMMGNLFENAVHADVMENTVVINHDVMPPSFACRNCRMRLRDFHDAGRGSTVIADIPKECVTMGGLNHDGTKLWISKGTVKWVEDTVHCRISVAIGVENAQRIMLESMGHHQVFVYGDHVEAVRVAADFMNFQQKII